MNGLVVRNRLSSIIQLLPLEGCILKGMNRRSDCNE